MPVGSDVVNDSGSSDVVETQTDSLDPRQAQEDIDAWAKDDKPANSRQRSDNGQFRRSSDSDTREVNDALRQTIKQGTRPQRQPVEEEQTEEETEPQEEQEQREPPKRRQVKGIVNGREELIDLSDDEFQKLNAVQASRAAQKAFREAAQMRKEAAELRRNLEIARSQVAQNPMALFEALGIPEDQVLQFAQQQTINKLSETIDPSTGQPYTPEQQRIIALQKQLDQKQQAEARQKQQAEQAEFEQLKDVMRQDIDRKFTAALQETGLPPTPYTMMRLANMMQDAGPDVDPQQLAPLVLEDMVNEVRHTIYSMPIDVAIEILGNDFVNALRKHDIEVARKGKEKFGRNPQHIARNAEQRQRTTQRRGADMTTGEAQDFLDQWANGR